MYVYPTLHAEPVERRNLFPQIYILQTNGFR
jgi:hypothetical protein